MKNEEQLHNSGSIIFTSKPPIEDWLKTVWEHFYVKYATPTMKQHPETETLSQLQAKIEEQLRSMLTKEQFQFILEWEDIKNRRHAIEIDRMYELGVKVGIRIQQEYSEYTKLPSRR